ncbi:hypothetical protein [Streptomyces sediminimaris]|uniref:hypothetical protein n=1 Tax=Streptomyces sediminimaris TaxID=3383721 RepID=UPI0039997FDA
MHHITTAPVAPIPARIRWAVAAGAGAALAAAWWLGDTAPCPYAQRGLLGGMDFGVAPAERAVADVVQKIFA